MRHVRILFFLNTNRFESSVGEKRDYCAPVWETPEIIRVNTKKFKNFTERKMENTITL